MTPEKQKLYDAFLAGTQAIENLPTVDTDWRDQILRGRFEEWLDEREAQSGKDAQRRAMDSLSMAAARSARGHE